MMEEVIFPIEYEGLVLVEVVVRRVSGQFRVSIQDSMGNDKHTCLAPFDSFEKALDEVQAILANVKQSLSGEIENAAELSLGSAGNIEIKNIFY